MPFLEETADLSNFSGNPNRDTTPGSSTNPPSSIPSSIPPDVVTFVNGTRVTNPDRNVPPETPNNIPPAPPRTAEELAELANQRRAGRTPPARPIDVFGEIRRGTIQPQRSIGVNYFLKKRNGSFLMWLSADDLYTVDALACHNYFINLNAARDTEFYFHASNYHLIREKDNTGLLMNDSSDWMHVPDKEYQIAKFILQGNYIHGNSIALSYDLVEKLGHFNNTLPFFKSSFKRYNFLVSLTTSFALKLICREFFI